MAWVIGIIVVIVIIGAISSAASKTEEAQKKAEFNEMARSRVDAYVDYVRRTSNSSEFARMTDLELKDVIGQKIRAYKTQASGLYGLGAFVWIAGGAFAAWQGMSIRAWGPFIIWLIIATAVGYFLTMFLIKKLDDEYRAEGFDPDRLKIQE